MSIKIILAFVAVSLLAQSPVSMASQPITDPVKQLAELKAENENLHKQLNEIKAQYGVCVGSLGNAIVQLQVMGSKKQ